MDDHNGPKESGRKPRADAQRNRLLLLEAAKTAFTETGPDASLDEIARRTGVGIGTLYRHFPTRDALIEAVYRHGVEQLGAAAAHLSETQPPLEALRAWMRLFVGLVATKKVIAPALNAIVGGPSGLYEESSAVMKRTMTILVERAVASGDIRLDLDPFDLLRALVGVSNASASPDWEASAHRLVDILIAGVRVPPGGP